MKKPVIFDDMTDPRLADILQAGAVGVLPTDTQYGLVASAAKPLSIERLYSLKRRQGEPGTLLAASVSQLEMLGLNRQDIIHAANFWPGAISVVVPSGPELAYLHLGRESLAVRIPHPVHLRRLLERTGVLQTSSANLTGQPPAGTVDQARAYFADSVDFYVDGGNLEGREPSTVIRLEDDQPVILRPGAVPVTATQQSAA